MTINERVSDERLNTIKSWRETYGQDANVMIPASEAESIISELQQYRAAAEPAVQAEQLSGNAEQVSQSALPFDQWLSQQTGKIDVDCGCVTTEAFFHWLRVAYEAGNSPVIPDGWIPVSERMPEFNDEVLVWHRHGFPMLAVYGACKDPKTYKTYRCLRDNDGEIYASHWQPLPAAPKQEDK